MVSFFRTFFMPIPRRVTAIILAFALLAGFLLGAYVATLAGPSSFSLMRTASLSCVSIVRLLPAVLLPFLFTAFAVYISQIWLLIPIAFLKAFIFSYLSSGILFLFRDSGWLVQFLLMFTDCLSFPVLCWLWIRICSSRKQVTVHCFTAACLVILGVICLDHQFISPFLVNLLSY